MSDKQQQDEDPQKKLDTDLLMSCSMGLTERVRELVDQGADLFTTHTDGKTALHYAALYGHKDLLEYCMEQHMTVDRANAAGQTPLFSAVENNRPDMIHLLIKAGADVNYRDHEGATPLHHAARRGRVESASALADHHANPLIADKSGQTALDIAKARNTPGVVHQISKSLSHLHSRRLKRRYRGMKQPRP